MALNAVLIGLGKWAQRLVKATQGRSDFIRFTAAVTRTIAKAASFAEAYDIRLNSELEAVLADPSIDMAVIATPHSLHAEHAMACVTARKHAFVIKPLTMSLDTAKAVSAAADRAGVRLGVGFPWRHLPATKELKRLVTSGALGEIIYAESNYYVPRFMGFSTDDWKTHAIEQGVGALITHSVDVLTDLMGPITTISAISMRRIVAWPIDDVTSLLFRFANGCGGYIGTCGATGPLLRLAVFGSKGWAEIRNERRLEVQPTSGASMVKEFPDENENSLRWQLESFAKAVMGEPTYPWSREHDLHGVAVSDAVIEAASKGILARVKFP
jgi:predicted dehydrogenase